MGHPFYKSAKNTSGLPGRVSNSLWGKLKRYAHDVWEIGDNGEDLVAMRKREETADLDYESDSHPLINPGDVVVLLLGGRKLEARVLAQWEDGSFSVVSDEGYLDNVHESWLEKQAQANQPQPSLAEDGNRPSQRTITREDIPVQSVPQQSPGNETVDQLQKLLEARGGHIAVEISPSSILELQASGQGVNVKLWHISTEIAHQGNYPSLASAVAELGLTGWYQERPVQNLQTRR